MAEINVAYALLRDATADMHARTAQAAAAARRRIRSRSARCSAASWSAALEPGEEVVVVTDAATWDSFRVRLAVTDRRLLWLRDDAPTDRVRYAAVARRRRRSTGACGGRGGGSASCASSRATAAGCPSPSSSPNALRLVLLGARKHVPAT